MSRALLRLVQAFSFLTCWGTLIASSPSAETEVDRLLAAAEEARDAPAESLRLARQALRVAQEGSRASSHARVLIADSLVKQGDCVAARDQLQRALEVKRGLPATDSWELNELQLRLETLSKVSTLSPENQAHFGRSALLMHRSWRAREQADADACLTYLREAATIRRQLLGEKHVAYGDVLFRIAEVKINLLFEPNAGIEICHDLIEALKSSGHGQSTLAATCLECLGLASSKIGGHRDASQYFLDADAVYKTLQVRARRNWVNRLNLASALIKCGDLAEAEAVVKTVVESEFTKSEQQVDLQCWSLHLLGTISLSKGKTRQAKQFLKKSLARRRRQKSVASTPDVVRDLAHTLDELGIVCLRLFELDLAKRYLREAFELRRSLHQFRHPDTAASLINLGTLHRLRGEYFQARALYEQAYAIRSALHASEDYPDGHPQLAASLNSLGIVMRSQGDLDGARVAFSDALRMQQRLFPREKHAAGHRSIATAWINLAIVVKEQGDLHSAHEYVVQAEGMLENLMQASSQPDLLRSDRVACLMTAGSIAAAQRDYDRAVLQYEACLVSASQLFPASQFAEGHATLVAILHNLGAALEGAGRSKEARQTLTRALEMQRQLYPSDQFPHGHAQISRTLVALGQMAHEAGDLPDARRWLEEAFSMTTRLHPREQYPRGHPDLAANLSRLADLSESEGQLTEARRRREQALEMLEGLYPVEDYPHGHPALADELSYLGDLLYRGQDSAEAKTYLKRALEMQNCLALDFIASSSEFAALSYLDKLPRARAALLSVIGGEEEEEAAEVYQILWHQRHAVTRALFARRQELASVEQGPLQELLLSYRDVRAELGRLALADSRGTQQQRAQRNERIKQLTEQKEELERKLGADAPTDRQFTPRDLQASLPDNAVYLDFFKYHRLSPQASEEPRAHYMVFVLTANRISRVDLGPALRLEAAIQQFREAPLGDPEKNGGAILRNELWSRLAVQFPPETVQVFVAPDGAVSRLPWAAIPGNDQHTILLQDYAFALVSLPELLAQPEQAARSPVRFLIVGNVDYEGSNNETTAERASLFTRSSRLRGTRVRRGNQLWGGLPETKVETRAISARISEGTPIQFLEGREANVQNVVRLLPQVTHAHLATHGFLVGPDVSASTATESTRVTDWRFRNPLLSSGLVLAGANRPKTLEQTSETPPDSGILTAEEIAALPLKLELATLSACETGLGKISNEGVYGLQRAFHLAGTKTVVASLWKVRDAETRALMVLFYDNLLRRRLGRLESLRQAQLKLWSDSRKESGSSRGLVRKGVTRHNADGWAAWTLSGKWD